MRTNFEIDVTIVRRRSRNNFNGEYITDVFLLISSYEERTTEFNVNVFSSGLFDRIEKTRVDVRLVFLYNGNLIKMLEFPQYETIATTYPKKKPDFPLYR